MGISGFIEKERKQDLSSSLLGIFAIKCIDEADCTVDDNDTGKVDIAVTEAVNEHHYIATLTHFLLSSFK